MQIWQNVWLDRYKRRTPQEKPAVFLLRDFQKFSQKALDKQKVLCYNNPAERYGPVAQLVRALACHARGRGFEPHPGRQFLSVNEYADLAHLVERHLAKVEVAGSSPVIRSKNRKAGQRPVFCFGANDVFRCSERDEHFVRDVSFGSDVRFAREKGTHHITVNEVKSITMRSITSLGVAKLHGC